SHILPKFVSIRPAPEESSFDCYTSPIPRFARQVKVSMNTNTTIALSGLARRLVKDGILAEQSAQDAFHNAAREKKPFVSYLVENSLADGYAIAEAASDEFGTPLFDLNAFNMSLTPKGLVDSK